MLKDNGKIEKITNLANVPIPVDVHVARASLALGVVRGNYQGQLDGVFPKIREVWKQGVTGLSTDKGPMISLDVDEPLWHLSKFGCSKRDVSTGQCQARKNCPVEKYCVKGSIHLKKGELQLNTSNY